MDLSTKNRQMTRRELQHYKALTGKDPTKRLWEVMDSMRPANALSGDKIDNIRRMRDEGHSKANTERVLGINLKTVTKYWG